MKKFLLFIFALSMLVLVIRTCSRKPQSVTKVKKKAKAVKIADKKTESKSIAIIREQIKEVIKAEKKEAMYLPEEININASMISITLLMRTGNFTTKGLLKDISYSLIPKLQKIFNGDRIIRLWFQRNLEGGKVMLYGNATLSSHSSKIEFKFY